jgi:hypothetical protein
MTTAFCCWPGCSTEPRWAIWNPNWGPYWFDSYSHSCSRCLESLGGHDTGTVVVPIAMQQTLGES